MSIQTDLTRIKNAKAAIKTAIEGKSVTVPDGILLDGMAALIDAIEAGGGAKIAAGTVVPANDNSLTIEHGLGKVPNVFFWCTTDFAKHTTTISDGGVRVASKTNGDTLCGGHINGQSFVIKSTGSRYDKYYYELYSNNQDAFSRKIYALTSKKIKSNADMLAYSMAGETVRWIAMVV